MNGVVIIQFSSRLIDPKLTNSEINLSSTSDISYSQIFTNESLLMTVQYSTEGSYFGTQEEL
jgi:hypothetical protein